MNNIEENNKMIAEFMSMVYQQDCGYWTVVQWSKRYTDYEVKIGILSSDKKNESLYFAEDWNWLMCVVEKIESIEPFYVEISETTCYIVDRNLGKPIINESGEQKIISVYKAVVSFIEHFND